MSICPSHPERSVTLDHLEPYYDCANLSLLVRAQRRRQIFSESPPETSGNGNLSQTSGSSLAPATAASDPRVAAAIVEVLARPSRQPAACTYRPPSGFRPKETLEIGIQVPKGRTIASA